MSETKRLNHIAIIVDDIEQAIVPYVNGLGLIPSEIEYIEAYNTRIVFLPIGDTQIELLQPIGDKGELQEFLKKGGGLHHIAFEVDNIEVAIQNLQSKGIEMIDTYPKPGAQNTSIAFTKSDSFNGVSVEVVEQK